MVLKSNIVIGCIGSMYLAIGFCFLLLDGATENSIFDLTIMFNVINGITISSLLFAISDWIEQIFLSNAKVIALNKILEEDIDSMNTKLDVYEIINTKVPKAKDISTKSQKINALVPVISWLQKSFYYYAVPIGIFVIMLKNQISSLTSVSFSIIIFGLFITSIAYTEKRNLQMSLLIDRIWFEYYKKKSDETDKEETENE